MFDCGWNIAAAEHEGIVKAVNKIDDQEAQAMPETKRSTESLSLVNFHRVSHKVTLSKMSYP